MALTLFSAQGADGNSATFIATSPRDTTIATIAVWGTFGAGTVAFKMSPDAGTTWLDFPTPITFTANGTRQVSVPASARIRAELTGSTAPSLNCTVYGAD